MPRALLGLLLWAPLVTGCNAPPPDGVGSGPTAEVAYDTTLYAEALAADPSLAPAPDAAVAGEKADAEPANAESADAGDPYWYYIRSGSGGFYDYSSETTVYSQVVRCPRATRTPGIYSPSDAVGPFDSVPDALAARNSDVDLARRSGRRIANRNATCDTRWR